MMEFPENLAERPKQKAAAATGRGTGFQVFVP
jgi:hypothetical protein